MTNSFIYRKALYVIVLAGRFGKTKTEKNRIKKKQKTVTIKWDAAKAASVFKCNVNCATCQKATLLIMGQTFGSTHMSNRHLWIPKSYDGKKQYFRTKK